MSTISSSIIRNKKTTLCKYYLKNKCNYNSELCIYAHGITDLRKVDCKYGVHCNNPKCNYYHGDILIKEYKYEPNIVFKNKKSKIFKKDTINYIYDNKHLINNIYDKPQIPKIKENINNKLLIIIDDYYLDIISKKDNLILEYKKKISEYEKQIIPKRNIYKNTNKYNKYLEIYDIISNKSNYEKINEITKDKNISKIYLRSKKVKDYMDIIKKYDIKKMVPISIILNSTKKTFLELLNKLIIK